MSFTFSLEEFGLTRVIISEIYGFVLLQFNNVPLGFWFFGKEMK
jgi:hypothetical protein